MKLVGAEERSGGGVIVIWGKAGSVRVGWVTMRRMKVKSRRKLESSAL